MYSVVPNQRLFKKFVTFIQHIRKYYNAAFQPQVWPMFQDNRPLIPKRCLTSPYSTCKFKEIKLEFVHLTTKEKV